MKTWKAGELREDMLVVPAHVVQTKYATIDRDELRQLQKDAERYRWLRTYAYGCFPYGKLEDLFSYNDAIIDEKVDALLAAQGDSA